MSHLNWKNKKVEISPINWKGGSILVVVPLHVGFRGALDHPTQAVSRRN